MCLGENIGSSVGEVKKEISNFVFLGGRRRNVYALIFKRRYDAQVWGKYIRQKNFNLNSFIIYFFI